MIDQNKLLYDIAITVLNNATYSGPGHAKAAFKDKMSAEISKVLKDHGAEIKLRTAEKI